MTHFDCKISILIPCYNQANLIGQTVDTILKQTRPPDEIIVVDDASTDKSVEVLSKLPIRLLRHQTNQGPAVARNTALGEALGEIVIYIDADAIADHHLIESILKAYQQPTSYPLGGIGGRGIETNIRSVHDRWRAYHAKQDYGPRMHHNVPYLYGLCASYIRSTLLEVGGFDPFFPTNAGEDADLGYRLRRTGYRLHYTPDAIVYHQHSDTAETLKRVQYNWFFWSYLAKKRSRLHPWTLFIGTTRRLFTDTLADLVIRNDLDLVRLDLEIFTVKMKALIEAVKFVT